MYDYGARMYMPDIGRWGVVDPLAELQFKYSPYAYVNGNPISFNDPSGMIAEGPGPEYDNDGKAHDIQEVIITKIIPRENKDASLSWMGINSLSAFNNSSDRFAAAINRSPAALATEKFNKNLAFGIGTMLSGGSNIAVSAGWTTLNAWLDYQDPEDQKAIQKVQIAVLLIQIEHGNIKALDKLATELGHTPDQIALRDLVKEQIKLNGGHLTNSEATTALELTQDVNKNASRLIKQLDHRFNSGENSYPGHFTYEGTNGHIHIDNINKNHIPVNH